MSEGGIFQVTISYEAESLAQAEERRHDMIDRLMGVEMSFLMSEISVSPLDDLEEAVDEE